MRAEAEVGDDRFEGIINKERGLKETWQRTR
jgi:hypothetical protein